MKNDITLPATIGDKSLTELINQVGTTATIKSEQNKQTWTIKYQEEDCAFQCKIEKYPNGSIIETKTTSPNVPAKFKKQAMTQMKNEGKTQQEIANVTGTSQSTVSKILNS